LEHAGFCFCHPQQDTPGAQGAALPRRMPWQRQCAKKDCTFRPHVEQLEGRLVPAVSFNRVVVDPSSPSDPWMKAQADLNGDGFQDLIVAGDTSDLVWYSYSPSGTSWTKHTIASGVT